MFKHHQNASAVVFAGLLLLFSLNLVAQKDKTHCDYSIPGEVLNWNFGDKAQLTFSEDTPFPFSSAMPGGIDIPKGVSSISDADGNLLFFSDGMTAWGKGYYPIINGTLLAGSKGATQAALFIPSPDNENKYFLFTSDFYYPDIPQYSNNGIRYSVIEKINYRWEVTEKNIHLLDQNTQKLAAVKHANGTDYWLVTHGFGNEKGNKYFAYKVMKDSVSTVPVISETNIIHTGTSQDNNSGGYMKISTNGKKIVLVIPSKEEGIVEIADFDTETGHITNPAHSAPGHFNLPLGLEFSPDNRFLYMTTNPTDNSQNFLYQFDLNQLDINNPVEIARLSPSDNAQFGALQLAVDGRIYLARFGLSISPVGFLGVIHNPNRPGTACNFNYLDGVATDGLALNDGSGSMEGLPNFVSSYFDIPSFWWQNHCATHITTFRLQNEANNGQVSWDFGHGGATDNQLRGQYTYQEADTYTVTVTEVFEGETFTQTRDITIYPLPTIDIGAGEDIIYILPNSSITLDAGIFDQYYWEDEDGNLLGEGQYLDVDQEGVYAVTVTDINCCENRDEVEIKFANIYMPNAFRPGSQNPVNTSFKALGPVTALNQFQLLIYNRWGQLVYESTDPFQGWDGKVKGEDAPQATYIWQLTYESFESQYQAAQKIVERGIVNLIR